jgi:predicted TIM-barrel fold metal-dependent hydrolase
MGETAVIDKRTAWPTSREIGYDSRPMRTLVVDHQAHWYPPAYFDSIAESSAPPQSFRDSGDTYVFVDESGVSHQCPPSFHSLEAHIADMDRNGVDVSVISTNLVGDLSRLPIDDAVCRLELLNSEVSRVQRAHRDRIVGLAMLPMQDPDAAVQVLDRAISEHDLAGVCMLSNIAGAPIVDESLTPVYRRIEELGVPIFLHPAHSSVVDCVGYGPTIEIGLGWMFETAAAALSLVYGGVLDTCPDLTVVHPHLGGALPAVVDRVVECEIGVTHERGLRDYLRRNFYVDTVQKTPAATRLAIDTYGIDRVVIGTDFPWVTRQGSLEATKAVLDSTELEQVLTNRVPNLRVP